MAGASPPHVEAPTNAMYNRPTSPISRPTYQQTTPIPVRAAPAG